MSIQMTPEISRIATACVEAVTKGHAHVTMGPAEYQKLTKFLVDHSAEWDSFLARYLPREFWGTSLAIVVVYTLQLPNGKT